MILILLLYDYECFCFYFVLFLNVIVEQQVESRTTSLNRLKNKRTFDVERGVFSTHDWVLFVDFGLLRKKKIENAIVIYLFRNLTPIWTTTTTGTALITLLTLLNF